MIIKLVSYAVAGLCLVLSIVVGSTVVALNSLVALPVQQMEPILMQPPSKDGNINLLILGSDAGVYDGGVIGPTRTDTIVVASFNPQTLDIHLLSIPRDSRVVIPGRPNLDKINAAHVYGGLQMAVDTVQHLLDAPLHYYVKVDHAGFRKIIDAIGGVDYFVEFDMDYEDPYQDLYIHLKQGQQKLTGDKAEQYVRFRGNGSDISRIKRQQKFLMAALRTVLTPANLPRIPELVNIVRQSITTNIDAADIVTHLRLLDTVSDKNVTMHLAPGADGWKDGRSYWLLDYKALDAILQEHFWERLQGNHRNISVIIEDASGTNAGSRAKEVLERRGFNVVTVKTGTGTIAETRITAHGSNDVAGLNVYRVLRQGAVYSEKTLRDADVTITLGSDFIR